MAHKLSDTPSEVPIPAEEHTRGRNVGYFVDVDVDRGSSRGIGAGSWPWDMPEWLSSEAASPEEIVIRAECVREAERVVDEVFRAGEAYFRARLGFPSRDTSPEKAMRVPWMSKERAMEIERWALECVKEYLSWEKEA